MSAPAATFLPVPCVQISAQVDTQTSAQTKHKVRSLSAGCNQLRTNIAVLVVGRDDDDYDATTMMRTMKLTNMVATVADTCRLRRERVLCACLSREEWPRTQDSSPEQSVAKLSQLNYLRNTQNGYRQTSSDR